MRGAIALAGASALTAGAPSPTLAESGVDVTVYNNDLALVKDRRTIEVQPGVSEYAFTGVPALIDPTSVRFDPGKGGELGVLEQNFRYDLVSREKLLERYLDKPTKILTKHDKFHEGILKTASGSLVLQTDDGVVVLTEDEVADITLPEIPEGLITRPTLVWRLDNGGPKSRDVEIAYLTNGMAWHAEYVAAVDPKDTKMSLSGWVSIENHSGATYKDANLKVVAGDVHRVTDQPPMPLGRMKDMAMAAEGAQFEERAFFEYHIYDLQRPATIADREVKQIQLFPDREVPIRKVYVYEPTRVPDKVQVEVEFKNEKDQGLGMPLPGGKFRVYREDADGALEFAGEDRIDHTARDEKVSVALGNAFDLVGERTERESRRVSDRIYERSVEIKLRNRKESEAVTILVREHPGGDWKVLESSHEWKKPKAADLEFEIPVKAGEEIVLTYRVRSEF
jgi:hypothetical protein